MKYLSQFVSFDLKAFMEGKKLEVVDVRDYIDFTTKEHIGSKVEVVITEDHTHYVIPDGRPAATNRYEKLILKINKDVDIPIGAVIVPKGATAKVYGDYNNLLSISCEDIVVVGKEKSHEAH